MKKLRGYLLWLLLFGAGIWLGRAFFPPQSMTMAAENEDVVPERHQGEARIAPLSEAEKLLGGGGSPESLEQLRAEPVPPPAPPLESSGD